MSETIVGTEFDFPGQTEVYHGKVRDIYTINETILVAVASDRISAFDVILPRPIPYKGQVLNQLAAHFLTKTNGIVQNWFINMPDPNVSIGYKCEPIKVEMVVRGMLVGHAWREYSSGSRELCGASMAEGLGEYDLFPQPLITPTTKEETGHDKDISGEMIIQHGILNRETYYELYDLSLKLFDHGQSEALKNGLILADTKYEFGILDNEIYIIDEVHTPDSSRYFYEESVVAYLADRSKHKPKNLSKEFVRIWLAENGFSGQLGQEIPEMTDEFINVISDRYIELFERLTGQQFVKHDQDDLIKRIEVSVNEALKGLDYESR